MHFQPFAIDKGQSKNKLLRQIEVVDQDWTTLLKVKEKFCVQNGCFLQFDEASYDIHTA